MIRFLLAIGVLAALSRGIFAEGSAVHLAVQPMAAPKPALKYQLLPEVRELNPGNPAQWYIRCFQEQRNFFFSKEGTAQRARYQSMPLAELREKKLRPYGGNALRQVDWGARLDSLDWEVLQRVQTDGMDLRLPELKPLLILGAALQVRFRAEVAGRHFDDAVRNAKTMFALARHLGEHPTEAGNHVGLAVANLALDTLEEMVQQPGCPNLYWALTDLPNPLVDLRKGFQGAGILAATDLRPLRDNAPMTDAAMEELVSRLSGRMGFARGQAGRPPRSLRAGLTARVKDPEKVHAARARLIEAGCAEITRLGSPPLQVVLQASKLAYEIGKFPPLQVILLDEKRAYEIRRDEGLKLLGLAPWQIDALSHAGEVGRGSDELFADLLPDVIKGRQAQGRLEQRIALLRHVEALRLYTAAHDGKLPPTLSDILVPLPTDPFTGKPFLYKVEGAFGHLRGRPPSAEEKTGDSKFHFEVAIQK